MIQKQNLVSFIDKYYLGGNTEAARIKLDGTTISTNFISDNQSIIGLVSYDLGKSISPDSTESNELGVFSTGNLLKMLAVLDSEIDIQFAVSDNKFVKLTASDKDTNIMYMLAELSVIKQAPTPKKMPEFGIVIEITPEFRTKFTKAKSGIPDSTNFAIESDGTLTNMIINYSTITSSNIKFAVNCKSSSALTKPKAFNSDALKDILNANKDATSGTLEISSSGLARLTFSSDNFKSIYYLVELSIS